MCLDNEYYTRCEELYHLILKAYIDKSIIVATEQESVKHLADNSFESRKSDVLGHLIELAKNDLALTVWKIYCDNDNRANTLKHLNAYLNSKEICLHKKTKLSQKFDDLISELDAFRKKFLAHNDSGRTNVSLPLSELYLVLDEIRNIYNDLCSPFIDDRVQKIKDEDCYCIEINTALGMMLLQSN